MACRSNRALAFAAIRPGDKVSSRLQGKAIISAVLMSDAEVEEFERSLTAPG
jgi:hypothetical protein